MVYWLVDDPLGGEPTLSLRTALSDMGWGIRYHLHPSWPDLHDDPPLEAQVVVTPRPGDLPEGAFFTDASVGVQGGGAAAVAVDPSPATGAGSLVHILNPRSSTHCELVAIKLAVQSKATAVFSDSLSSLLILRDWGKWSLSRRLKCLDRVEVRAILHAASAGPLVLLEKVKAHRVRRVVMMLRFFGMMLQIGRQS